MKCPINQKDFRDKANLGKKLNTALKKPVGYLLKNTNQRLPFYYEFEYIDGDSFVAIGVAKELHKIFKKRVKGNENGEKLDKKKVAFGEVFVDDNGVFKFLVQHGTMKPMQAKQAIKSVGFLKKNIGDKYEILKGEVVEETEDTTDEDVSDEPLNADALKKLGEQLVKAYGAFRNTELAAFSKQKNAATIKAVITKGAAISKKMLEFLAEADENTALATLSTTVQQHKTKLDETVNKIKDAVKAAQAKSANGEVDKVKSNIEGLVSDLLKNYASEIESIGGLKEALESVTA